MDLQDQASHKPSPRRRRSQGILRGIALTMAGSYYDLATSLVQTIIVLRLIGVTNRGLMAIAYVFVSWLSNAHLGALQGLSKQLPMALGRREEDHAQELEDVGIVTVLALGFLGALGMLGYALWASHLQLLTREVLACGALILICTQASTVYRVVLRAWGTFSVLTIAGVVFNTAQLLLVIAGAWRFNVLGAMVGLLLAHLCQLLYLHLASHLRIHLRFNWSTAWYLIRSGIPLWGTIFAETTIRNVPRVLCAQFFGAYYLGLYDPAARLAEILNRLPDAMGFALVPHLWQGYARDGAASLRRHVLLPTLATAIVMPALSGVLFIFTPFLFGLIVPRFIYGAFAAQILALGAVFLGLPLAANGLLVAMNREWTVTAAKFSGALVISLGAGFLYLMHDRFGVVALVDRLALLAALGFAVSSLCSLIPALRQYHRGWRLAGEIALFHAPLVWACVAIWTAGRLTSLLLPPGAAELAHLLTRTALFLLLYAPVLWWGDRQAGVLQRFRALRKKSGARAA